MTITDRVRQTGVAPSSRDPIADWLDVLEKLLGLPPAKRRAIRAELEDHLRSRVDDLTITGLSEPEAVRTAVAELGETAELARSLKDAGRSHTRRLWMHALAFSILGGAITMGTLSAMPGGAPLSTAPMVAVEPGIAAPGTEERMRRYDVRDLIFADEPLDAGRDGDRLLNTIVEIVNPEGWRVMGGEDRIIITGNTLFVDASSETHDSVEWLLASLASDAEQLRVQQAEEEEAAWRDRMLRADLQYRALEDRFAELTRLAHDARAQLDDALQRVFEAEAMYHEAHAEMDAFFGEHEDHEHEHDDFEHEDGNDFEHDEHEADDENEFEVLEAFSRKQLEARRAEIGASIDREQAEARLAAINEELIDVELSMVQARSQRIMLETRQDSDG